MKKLMIALGVVAMAACAQAASVTWTITNVKASDDPTAAGDGYAAYLFLSGNTTGVSPAGVTMTTLATVEAMIGTEGWQKKLADLSIANVGLSSAGSATSVEVTKLGDAFSSGHVTCFSIVFDADTLANADNYYVALKNGVAEVSNVDFTSSTGSKPVSFGSQATTSAADGAWKSIPEPTSGLLLLIGVAGLALRRRRA